MGILRWLSCSFGNDANCIGHFLSEDPLSDRVKPMIPTVAALLAELYPDKKSREWLPVVTIVYMHQVVIDSGPCPISALLDRLSSLVYQTRPLALSLTFKQLCRRILNGDRGTVADQRCALLHRYHSSSLILGQRWVATRLRNTFLREGMWTISFILDLLEKEFCR